MKIISYALIVYLTLTVTTAQAIEYENATYGIRFEVPEDWIEQDQNGIELYEKAAKLLSGVDIDYDAVFTSSSGDAWILIQEIPVNPAEYFKYLRENMHELSDKYGVETSVITDQDDMLLYETYQENGGGLVATYSTNFGVVQLSLNSNNSVREVYSPVFSKILDSITISKSNMNSVNTQIPRTLSFNWGHILGSALGVGILSMFFIPFSKKKNSDKE